MNKFLQDSIFILLGIIRYILDAMMNIVIVAGVGLLTVKLILVWADM